MVPSAAQCFSPCVSIARFHALADKSALKDWDFKWEKGYCLNSLGSSRFPITSSNLVDPAANIPKAVKRVHEIFKKPTFMENILPGDIKQGNLGDCWLIASLTGLANVPDGIKRICVEYDTS